MRHDSARIRHTGTGQTFEATSSVTTMALVVSHARCAQAWAVAYENAACAPEGCIDVCDSLQGDAACGRDWKVRYGMGYTAGGP